MQSDVIEGVPGAPLAPARGRPHPVRRLPALLPPARRPAGLVLRARAPGRRASCSPPTGARPASASTRSRRSRSTTSCRARRSSPSAPPAATSPASSARTGTSPRREAFDRLQDLASPEAIARAAERSGCRSVAYTYNDPVIFLEYAIDVAQACRERGHQERRGHGRLHLRGAARRVLPPHGRRQHRPQGVHRGLLQEALRGRAPAGARHAASTSGTRPTSGSR